MSKIASRPSTVVCHHTCLWYERSVTHRHGRTAQQKHTPAWPHWAHTVKTSHLKHRSSLLWSRPEVPRVTSMKPTGFLERKHYEEETPPLTLTHRLTHPHTPGQCRNTDPSIRQETGRDPDVSLPGLWGCVKITYVWIPPPARDQINTLDSSPFFFGNTQSCLTPVRLCLSPMWGWDRADGARDPSQVKYVQQLQPRLNQFQTETSPRESYSAAARQPPSSKLV